MNYSPVSLPKSFSSRKKTKFSFGANKGLNLRDLPQLLDPQNALLIQNYLTTGAGRLIKRKGLRKIFEIAGDEPITLLKKFTKDIWIFAYGTTVARYRISDDAVATVKSDFLDDTPFGGVKYGEYFFLSNGGNKIGYVSSAEGGEDVTNGTFATDTDWTKGAGWTINGVVASHTGASSVLEQDITPTLNRIYIVRYEITAYTSGNLKMGGCFANINLVVTVGTHTYELRCESLDNLEIISDGVFSIDNVSVKEKDATSSFTSISDAPKAKRLYVHNGRLFAGNTDSNESEVRWSEQDSGSGVPFTNWSTASTPPAPDDPDGIIYRDAGAVNAIGSLGDNIIVLFDDGKAGFKIDVLDVGSSGLAQKTDMVLQKIDFGGSRGAASTTEGIFYSNEHGVFLLSGTQREHHISALLGEEYMEKLDLGNADIIFSPERQTVFVACAKDSTVNNLVLWYDVKIKAWGEITGWNISRFMRMGDTLYGASATETKVFQLFYGYDDDGQDIWTDFRQEIKLDSLTTLHKLTDFFIQGELSASSNIKISFDVYDREGNLVKEKQSLEWSANDSAGGLDGVGSARWGESGYGGDVESPGMIESLGQKRMRMNNLNRLQVRFSENSKVAHQINWFSFETQKGKSLRKDNLV